MINRFRRIVPKPKAIIIGGNGALGKHLINSFKNNWSVTSIDLMENHQADINIILNDNVNTFSQNCNEKLSGKYKAIISVAGSWESGGIKEIEIFHQVKKLVETSLQPSILAGQLATKYLHDSGLLLFTGALRPFKNAYPENLAYSLIKNAIHSLALNMSARDKIPIISTVTTILPDILNTEVNRDAMPYADRSEWIDPSKLAALIKDWADGYNTPINGSFASLKVVNGKVIPEFI